MAGVDDRLGNTGEKLFAKYLAAHSLLGDHESEISGIAKRNRLRHVLAGRIRGER